jgi:hypothetical protein
MKNINAFKKLIKRYETITLDEIKEANMNLVKLTGFSSTRDCILCREACNILGCDIANTYCHYCIWAFNTNPYLDCLYGVNNKTYYAIEYALDPESLLTAYHARAAHMRERLIELGYTTPS